MGIKQASKTRYLYEIYDNYTFKQTDYYATFEKDVFQVGTFRYAYKGIIKNKARKPTKPDLFPNEKCIVKIFKNKKYTIGDFIIDLDNYYYSRKVSSIFNSEYKESSFVPKFNYIPSYVSSIERYSTYKLFYIFPIRDRESMKKIQVDEWVTIEPLLDGKFKKFINNDCVENYDTDWSISLFMHWNWAYSKGKKLICDIQGEEKYKSYELTDPAVQSINSEYCFSDLGPCSLINFLINHNHNELCKNLPWPSEVEMKKLYQIKNNINYIEFTGDFSFCKNYKNLYQEIINSTFIKKENNINNYNYIKIIILFIFIFILFFGMIMKKRKSKKLKRANKYSTLKVLTE